MEEKDNCQWAQEDVETSKNLLNKTNDLIPHFFSIIYFCDLKIGIKGWYWPQGLLSMLTDNSHKYWEKPSDKTSVSSASKSDFLTSSIVIPGQCSFSCSGEERTKESSRGLKTETFG